MTEIYLGRGGGADLPRMLGMTAADIEKGWAAFLKGSAK